MEIKILYYFLQSNYSKRQFFITPHWDISRTVERIISLSGRFKNIMA